MPNLNNLSDIELDSIIEQHQSQSTLSGLSDEELDRLIQSKRQSPYPQFGDFPAFTPLTPNTDLPIPPIQAERQQVFENAFVKGLAGINRPELGYEEKHPVLETVGQLAGTGISLVGATKLVGLAGKIPQIGKLFQLGRGAEGVAQLGGKVASSAIRGGAVGATLGTGQQIGSALTGGEFDVSTVAKDAVIFGVIDAVTTGLGSSIKIAKEGYKASRLQRALEVGDAKEAEVLIKELRPSLPSIQKKQLDDLLPYLQKINEGKPLGLSDTPLGEDPVVNEVQRKTLFDPKKELTGQEAMAGVAAPIVRQSEENVLKEATILENRPVTRGKVNFSIQTPLRFFNSLGEKVKELGYYPTIEAEKLARLDTDDLVAEFRKLWKVKGITKNSSERITVYGTARQEGGIEIV